MIEITAQNKDNIESWNVGDIFSKYPIICITWNYSKHILYIQNNTDEMDYKALDIKKLSRGNMHQRTTQNEYCDVGQAIQPPAWEEELSGKGAGAALMSQGGWNASPK
jgi:hypothetical protein